MTYLDEIGLTHCSTCAGVTPPPPRPDYGGTVVRCECGKLPTTLEVVGA